MYRNAGYIEHIPHIFICAGWRKGGYDSCEGMFYSFAQYGASIAKTTHFIYKQVTAAVRWWFNAMTNASNWPALSAGALAVRSPISPVSTQGYQSSETGSIKYCNFNRHQWRQQRDIQMDNATIQFWYWNESMIQKSRRCQSFLLCGCPDAGLGIFLPESWWFRDYGILDSEFGKENSMLI